MDSITDRHKRIDEWISQLLFTKQYGERYGRHWLDVARWAESNGHQHNRIRPHAWRYRDYVVQSFQENKPYNDFLTEQIAGDLLPYSNNNQIATGFLAAARYSGNELNKEIQRNDILVDVVNTTASAFLGLTMECAQCHSHKFDPISIRDYYRFQGFFANGQPGNIVLRSNDPEIQQAVAYRTRIYDSVHQQLVESRRQRGFPEPILVTPKNVLGAIGDRKKELFEQLEKQITSAPQTWAWYSSEGNQPPIAPHEMRWPLPFGRSHLVSVRTHLLIRGDVRAKGPEVKAGWPALFGSSTTGKEPSRIQLAKWFTSKPNPLTARVWVNRIWQWHFGKRSRRNIFRFRYPGKQAISPRSAGLACKRIDRQRLGYKPHTPIDPEFEDFQASK